MHKDDSCISLGVPMRVSGYTVQAVERSDGRKEVHVAHGHQGREVMDIYPLEHASTVSRLLQAAVDNLSPKPFVQV